MKLLLFGSILLVSATLPAPAPIPGLPVEIPGLDLHFATPEGWRIDRASTATELLLYPGKTKSLPLLRVRTFHGNFSARDRLSQMTRNLAEEEAGAIFEELETWEEGGRRFETVVAVHKVGVQEWHARFTLVDQPKEVQHGFWLFGRKKDLERQWKAVSASIASARTIGSPPIEAPKGGDPPPPGEKGGKTPPSTGGEFVWQDVQSGLQVRSWPADFQPDEKSLSRLSKGGVTFLPEDEDAPPDTRITLSRRSVGPLVTADGAAKTLEEKLSELPDARDIRLLQVRVAGIPSSLLRWKQGEGGKELSYQVYFFMRGSALFRLDYGSTEEWAGVRSRRDLLKDFVGGISFR